MMRVGEERRFDITLYRRPPGCSLASCSLGCLHVHNYLLLCYAGHGSDDDDAPVTVVDCPWGTHSPSGRVPCVEVYDRSNNTTTLVCSDNRNGLMTASSSRGDVECDGDMEEAEYIVQELERILLKRPGIFGMDGDHEMGFYDGMNAALYCLVKERVVPGVLASLWMDEGCCGTVTMPLYGHGLPWPLRKLLPWDMRRKMKKRYRLSSSSTAAAAAAAAETTMSTTSGAATRGYDMRVIEDAVKALRDCVQLVGRQQQQDMPGIYAVDPETPMSSDALLTSLLSMIRCFPIHASIREEAKKLDWYLDGIVRQHALGVMTHAVADTKWARVRSRVEYRSSTMGGTGDEDHDGRSMVESKAARYWLSAVGTVAAGYIVATFLLAD